MKLIDAHDPTRPLSLYLAFNAPHTPYQAPQEYLDRYEQISDPSRRAYAASITAMDDQIGRVLAALDEKHIRNDALVVFQSDNGGTYDPMFAGEGDMSKIKIPCDNGPYREGKGLSTRAARGWWPSPTGRATSNRTSSSTRSSRRSTVVVGSR